MILLKEKQRLEQTFNERYQKLNAQQKEAVDTIDGVVMVIAGPGTGKTEILSMRIANILRSGITAKPEEILCLTFSDDGSVNMRKRLQTIIGESANKVKISTFHSFCNSVIQEFPEYFGQNDLNVITDLERVQIIYEIIDGLKSNSVIKGDPSHPYVRAQGLMDVFSTMKKENWTPEYVMRCVDIYIESLPEREEYIYKRANKTKNIQVGDPKVADIQKETERVMKLREAASLFPQYQKILKDRALYEFDDMISWVISKMNDESIPLKYTLQERFQYVLVDEYQDTSGAQSEVVSLLMDYHDFPNLFVVGDDDQCIYGFQGARLQNIVDTYKKYSGQYEPVKVIVLNQNYRSTQAILDASNVLINNNINRLVNLIDELNLDKEIKSAHPRFAQAIAPKPVIKCYHNKYNEAVDIVRQIELLNIQGVPYNEIAILYPKHEWAEPYMDLFEKKGIPYFVKKTINVLEDPMVMQIINILQFINDKVYHQKSGDKELYEILHIPSLAIKKSDIERLSFIKNKLERKKQTEMEQEATATDPLEAYKVEKTLYELSWFQLLMDYFQRPPEEEQEENPNVKLHLENELIPENNFAENISLQEAIHEEWGIEDVEALYKLTDNLKVWLDNRDYTIPMMLQRILHLGGFLAHILKSEDAVFKLQLINVFFEFVKTAVEVNPRLRISDLLQTFQQMNAERIAMPFYKVVKSDDGVRLLTNFASKGQEFEHVFMIGALKTQYEGKRANIATKFKIPDTLTRDIEETAQEENLRRQFFVAVTRAKQYLQISYPLLDPKGKELEATKFLDEIDAVQRIDAEKTPIGVESDIMLQHLTMSLMPSKGIDIEIAQSILMSMRLKDYALSATDLSLYLRCPVSFYYEKILRAPAAKNDSLAFGVAVHFAMEHMVKQMLRRKALDGTVTFPEKDDVLFLFEKSLERNKDAFTEQQFDNRLAEGKEEIAAFYDEFVPTLHGDLYAEQRVGPILVNDVPIKGNIDLIKMEEGEAIVYDYKTGKSDKDKIRKATIPANPEDEKNLYGGDYWRQMLFYKLLLDNYQAIDGRTFNMQKGVFKYVRPDKNGEFQDAEIMIFEKDKEFMKSLIKEVYDKIQRHEFQHGCGEDNCQWCTFVKRYDLNEVTDVITNPQL